MKGEMEKGSEQVRVGVYVCHCGGNISDVIKVGEVVEAVKGIHDVVIARHYEFMCSDPGQNLVEKDIKELGVNRVVIAACTPRLHEFTFRRKMISAGLNPFLLEQANIREQGSWVHKHDPIGATAKAISLTRAAIAKVRLKRPLEMINIKSIAAAAIVGGGMAGLRAALDIAGMGINAFIIEKTPFVGGNAARLDKVLPTEEDAREILGRLIEEVRRNPLIEVRTNSEVTEVKGYIGNFTVKVNETPRGFLRPLTEEEYVRVRDVCPVEVTDGFNHGMGKRKAIHRNYRGNYPDAPVIDFKACNKCGKCADILGANSISLDDKPVLRSVDAGTILMASGYDHYEPYKGEYGYGLFPQVITLPQLVRLMDPHGPTGGKVLTPEGREPKNIGFIHCVGSRQLEGVNQPGRDGKVNNYCSRVCCTVTLQSALELKRRFPGVNVYEFYQDIRAYGPGHETKYYAEASRQNVLFLKYDPTEMPVIERDDERYGSGLKVRVKDLLTQREEIEVGVDLLVLSTGMMPADNKSVVDSFKLPVGPDRFLYEAHPKLKPVESIVGGVLLAGTAQAPMDITETCASASTASIKAMAILSGKNVQLEPYVANVDLEKCTGSGECIKACHYQGAIRLVEQESGGNKVMRAQVNPALCKGCGACVALCPARALEINGFELRQFEAMIDAFVGGQANG